MPGTIRRRLSDLSRDSKHAGLVAPRLVGWWKEVIKWPPDVFAVTSVLLSESGAYRLAVSPPPGERWPPRPGWNDEVAARADEWWRWISQTCAPMPPTWLLTLGRVIRSAGNVATASIADRWSLVCAIMELHAIADEASGGFGMPADPDEVHKPDEWKEYRFDANDLLARTDTLSHFAKDDVRVLPKMRTPQAGISLRSLSGNLAIVRAAEVDVLWSHVAAFANDQSSFNLLLLPVPLEVRSRDFQPAPGSLDNMDRKLFGFFRFEPRRLDMDYVERMLRKGADCSGGVDGVVLPELSVSELELVALKESVDRIFRHREKHVPFILAGVRGDKINRAHFAVNAGKGEWRDYLQAKHHRWCLDRAQILNYDIGAALHPSRRWWEDIEIRRRELRFIIANSWLGICPLICEDLARQDPVAQIIRALGPTLVIALLLDGPQLSGRWPARYATVLADDPGSSVLTFTPLGMSQRSVPPGSLPKRVVGLWKDAKTGTKELDLDPGASALLLTLCNEWEEEWMADGRSDGRTAAQLYLGHVEQLA
jgi:hypothetical protein